MTSFGINNAEEYAEEHNLVKYNTLQCLCFMGNDVNKCESCHGTGVVEITTYPQDFVLEIPTTNDELLLLALLKALGLQSNYGSIYGRKLRSRIEKWTTPNTPSAIYQLKNKLLNICREGESREELIIWG